MSTTTARPGRLTAETMEAAETRDARRAIAEPWPFAWTPPGPGGPPKWMENDPERWVEWVRWAA